jgi:hypothetical protein
MIPRRPDEAFDTAPSHEDAMYAAAKTDALLSLWTRARARRAVHTERDEQEAMLELEMDQARSRERREVPEGPRAAAVGSRR